MPPPARVFFVLPGGIFLLFRESAASVAARILEGSLTLHLTENFRHQHGRSPAQAEIRSWERSLPALVNALIEAGLDDVEVLVEYSLPLTSKRADALLAGVHPTTGEPSYVVVELKQWSAAYPEEDEPLLCRIDAYAQPVLNPIEQVRSEHRHGQMWFSRRSAPPAGSSSRRTTSRSASPRRRCRTNPTAAHLPALRPSSPLPPHARSTVPPIHPDVLHHETPSRTLTMAQTSPMVEALLERTGPA
jgi:hypothetical protein